MGGLEIHGFIPRNSQIGSLRDACEGIFKVDRCLGSQLRGDSVA